jgi:hypothetical protein
MYRSTPLRRAFSAPSWNLAVLADHGAFVLMLDLDSSPSVGDDEALQP